MNRPAQKIIVKPRNAQRGEKGKPVLAAWPNDYGGFNWRLEEGWSITSPDGEAFTTGRDGNCYLNGYSDEQKQRHEEQRPVPYDDDGNGIDDEPLPF